jgi:hypothetical protein
VPLGKKRRRRAIYFIPLELFSLSKWREFPGASNPLGKRRCPNLLRATLLAFCLRIIKLRPRGSDMEMRKRFYVRTCVCAASKNLRRASRKLPEKLVRSSRCSSAAKRQWVPERERECVLRSSGAEKKREREMRSKPIRREWPFASDFTQVRLNCFFLGYFPVLCFSLLLREFHFHYLCC